MQPSNQVRPLEHSTDLLKSFLAVHPELTERLRNKLDLTEEQLLGDFLIAAKALERAPDALIPLIDSESFKSQISSMTHNTTVFSVLQNILNPIPATINATLNTINPNERNPNEIHPQNTGVYKDWNTVNETTDAEKIAYLEAQVAALKMANEKLSRKVIDQQLEIERLSSPNYIRGSEDIPANNAPNPNKR